MQQWLLAAVIVYNSNCGIILIQWNFSKWRGQGYVSIGNAFRAISPVIRKEKNRKFNIFILLNSWKGTFKALRL